MLITGGWGDGRLSSVEIFDPNNLSLSCQLPNMTVGRNSHAAVGRTVCGGYEEGLKTCDVAITQPGNHHTGRKVQKNLNRETEWQWHCF